MPEKRLKSKFDWGFAKELTPVAVVKARARLHAFAAGVMFAASLPAQQAPPKPAIEMQLMNLGRSGPVVTALTASVKITNNSADYIYLLLFGEPSAIDDAGGRWSIVNTVAGAAYCPGPQTNPPSYRRCVGPRLDDNYLFPLNTYTEIGPGNSITVNYVFHGGGNKGTKYSLAHEIAFRVAKSPDDDAALSDAQKLKRTRFGSLSFDAVEAPIKTVVTSTIHFDEVK